MFITLKTENGDVISKDHPIEAVPREGSRIEWKGENPPVIGTVTSSEVWTSSNGFTVLFEPEMEA